MERGVLWWSVSAGVVKWVGVSPEEETSCLLGKAGVGTPPAPSPCGLGTDYFSLAKRRL